MTVCTTVSHQSVHFAINLTLPLPPIAPTAPIKPLLDIPFILTRRSDYFFSKKIREINFPQAPQTMKNAHNFGQMIVVPTLACIDQTLWLGYYLGLVRF